MTEKLKREKNRVLEEAENLYRAGLRGGQVSTAYERLKIRLMLCGLNAMEYEQSLRILRETLGL